MLDVKKVIIPLFLLILTGCVLDPGIQPGPTVTVTSPLSGDTVMGPVLSFTGTASYGYDVEGVYADLDSAGFSKVNGTTSWVTNYRNISSGNHSIRVFSKGISGLTSPTNTVNFLVTNYNFTNTNQWTVMIYLDGDNNLEYWAYLDFNEMEQGILDAMNAGSRDILTNFNVIVMFDRNSAWPYTETEPGGGDWWNTRLYRILPDADTTYFASERLDDGPGVMHHISPLGQTNMGDTNTLKWFIAYVKANYPAKNYALILWDHGAGAQYICVDDTSADKLYLDEVQQSIGSYFTNTSPLGILGFDACYMATTEVAYEFRNIAEYMSASMYTEDPYGWPYDLIFGGMTGPRDPKVLTASDFSKLIVESFRDYHENYQDTRGDTMSSVDLSKLPDLKTKIDLFAVQLYAAGKQTALETIRDDSVKVYISEPGSLVIPYYDINDLCNRIIGDSVNGFSGALKSSAQGVIDSLGSAVVYAYGGPGNSQSYYYGDGNAVKRGLSLFFSRGNLTYTPDVNFELHSASGAQSHFWFQWWYTSANVSAWWSGHYYGNLDFCDSDMDGTVETWRELLKAWYDPATNDNTPGSY